MTDSQLILEVLLLHKRGGCSPTSYFSSCCSWRHFALFSLLVSVQCILRAELHIGTKIHKQHIVLMGGSVRRMHYTETSRENKAT